MATKVGFIDYSASIDILKTKDASSLRLYFLENDAEIDVCDVPKPKVERE